MEALGNKRSEISEKIILVGFIIYIVSIMVSKAGLNVSAGVIGLGFIVNIKENIKRIKKMSKEYKMVIIFLMLYPFYDLFTPGGVKSVMKEISELYRIVPLALVPLSLKNKINFKAVSEVIVAVFCLSSIYSIITNDYSDRLVGFSTATITAHVGTLVMIYIYGMILEEVKIGKKIYYIGIILLGLYLISLTATRGAILGFILVSFLISILKVGKKALIILLVFLCISYYFLSRVNYLSKFDINRMKNDTSLNTRIRMWKVSYEYSKNSYFFMSGVGRDKLIDAFNIERKTYPNSLIESKYVGNPHSTYVLIFSEKGLYVFLIFTYIFIFRLLKKTFIFRGHFLYYSLLGSQIVYFISGLTEDNWRSLQMRAPYLMTLILLFLLENEKKGIAEYGKKNLEENSIK